MTRKERALRNLKQMCSDGRYLGSGSYAPLEVLEDFNLAIKVIEQEPRWIPCSERLPEENIDVLVIVEFPDGKDGTLQRIEIASFGSMYHLSSEKGWITNNFTRIARDEIKAWMPLPKLYKAESEDK